MPDDFPIYDLDCPVTVTLNLLVKRWSFFLLRAVAHEIHTFAALRRALGGRISQRTLADRLQELTRADILERRVDGKKISYHFTPRGQSARQLIGAACAWAAEWEGLSAH